MHLKSKKVIIVFCEKMMPFYQFCFGFIQRRRKIFKSNAKLCKHYANGMQVLCKTMPRKEKKSKAKKRKANKTKTNKNYI